MTPNNPRLALAVAFALAVPFAAEGSVSRSVKFEEKVDGAAAIVVGRCVKTESRWDAQKRFIVTYSTFEVEKTMKGRADSTVTVVTPGGEVDGIRQETIGAPSFAPGDENVLFVANSAAGPTVLFLDQGAYDIRTEGSQKIVEPVQSEAVRVDTQRGVAVATEEPKSLDMFERAVRERVRERRAQDMKMLEERAKEESLWEMVARNKALVFLALIGIAIATFIAVRRH